MGPMYHHISCHDHPKKYLYICIYLFLLFFGKKQQVAKNAKTIPGRVKIKTANYAPFY